MNKSSIVFSVIVTWSSSFSTYGQEIDLRDLQSNIDIFTGVLEDALGLDQNSGLFGMLRAGGVESTYLLGQGVVFEIRTPLANERNRLNLTSLNSAMQSLQSAGNPFERLSLQSGSLTARQQEANTPEVNSLYQSMIERIAKIDYSIAVGNAIEQASDSARSLRVLGNVDDSGYEELRAELEAMRESMQENLEQISLLEDEIRNAGTLTATTDSNESDINSRFDLLLESIEPLRQQAILKAAELKAETELAEQRYTERWHEEVREFEQNLYVVMCNYGSTLRALPEGEKFSIILKGLGEDSATTTRRPDKVHVIHKLDVQQCLQEEISIAELVDRSKQYSY